LKLLAALEESQQQRDIAQANYKTYYAEATEVSKRLAEAQQTIARAITIYETADMESDFDNVLTGMYEALKVTEGKS